MTPQLQGMCSTAAPQLLPLWLINVMVNNNQYNYQIGVKVVTSYLNLCMARQQYFQTSSARSLDFYDLSFLTGGGD